MSTDLQLSSRDGICFLFYESKLRLIDLFSLEEWYVVIQFAETRSEWSIADFFLTFL